MQRVDDKRMCVRRYAIRPKMRMVIWKIAMLMHKN